MCDVPDLPEAAKDEARRWHKKRQAELRELFWEWDPLGLLGGPVDEYDSLEDSVLSALAPFMVQRGDAIAEA
jgi:hypothetical protein